MTELLPPRWRREAQRKITVKDVLLLLLGAITGFVGNALFSGDLTITVLLTVVAVLTVIACVSIDRFRFDAEVQLGDIKREIDDHHASLREKLAVDIRHVHAEVQFVEDTGVSTVEGAGHENDHRPAKPKAAYAAATDAVKHATRSIFVIGDYSPPPDEGLALDPNKPPAERSEYFAAIEDILREHSRSEDPAIPKLIYRRYIQRPLAVYDKACLRENSSSPGIVLKKEDMVGDEQAFDHCRRALRIKADAARAGSEKVSIEVRLIPFLPNCPSVLLIDGHLMQFTIPTRIDQPGNGYAALGLLGVLVIQDHAGGTMLCTPFAELFDGLRNLSVFVKGVDDAIAVDDSNRRQEVLGPLPLRSSGIAE